MTVDSGRKWGMKQQINEGLT